MTTREEHDHKRELAWADIEVRSVNEEKRTVDYVMSDDSVDSYGEIVEQKWRLDRFRRAPIILFAHNRAQGGSWLGGTISQRESFPIGRAIPKTLKVQTRKDADGKRVGKELVGTVEFAPREVNEFADDVFRQIVAGFMPCGSVGFYPHDVRRETHDDVERYILSDNELFEFSPCPIGANANAVANAVGSREEREAYLEKRAAECKGQRSLRFDDESPAASGQETSTKEHDIMSDATTARLAELETSLKQARDNEKAALELAQSNERTATEATERATKAEQERDAARTELATAQESITTLTTERDAAVEKAAGFEGEAIELELRALVGKKFHASELEFVRADRKREGKEAFAKRMAARPDLNTGNAKIASDTTPSTLPEPSLDVPGTKTSEALNQAS